MEQVRSGSEASAAESPTAAAPVRRDRPDRPGGIVGWTACVLVFLAAAALAVIECFLVPLRLGSLPIPVSVPLALAGNVVLPRLAVWTSGKPLTAIVPPVLWLGVVLALSVQRAEGDLVVPGTITGLVFLFGGSVAGAYGAASSITRTTRPSRPIRA